jgi:CheY-like chemotaxis protein
MVMKVILVIEDTQSMREEIVQILEFEGYQTLSAADGHVGAQLAKSRQPDLIICDVLMPQADGFETVKLVRQDQCLRDTPFIFLTALTDASARQVANALGVKAYLTKPFTSDGLISAVEFCLQG